MTKVVGNMIWEGDFTSKDGIITCCCNGSFTFAGHMDMTDRAITVYKCEKCGKTLVATVKRDIPW